MCVCPRAPGSGLYCETSIDGIGTCWPRSAAGHMVSRPCPEMFYGVRYNTTSKCDAARENNGFKTRFNLPPKGGSCVYVFVKLAWANKLAGEAAAAAAAGLHN